MPDMVSYPGKGASLSKHNWNKQTDKLHLPTDFGQKRRLIGQVRSQNHVIKIVSWFHLFDTFKRIKIFSVMQDI